MVSIVSFPQCRQIIWSILQRKIEQEEKKTNPFLICSLSSEEQSRITDAVVDFVIEADEPITLPEKPV